MQILLSSWRICQLSTSCQLLTRRHQLNHGSHSQSLEVDIVFEQLKATCFWPAPLSQNNHKLMNYAGILAHLAECCAVLGEVPMVIVPCEVLMLKPVPCWSSRSWLANFWPPSIDEQKPIIFKQIFLFQKETGLS